MNGATIEAMRECAQGSLAGLLTFPEVVGKLMACGVESYHADLYRSEITYYLPSGESHVEKAEHSPASVATEFSAESVAAAVRDIQQTKQTYRDFLVRIMQAGTTQYFVYLTGKCVVYIGRDGSEHVERFPQTQ
jgi:uncharacterized protein YbcV (DUF1398 family)